MRHTRHRLDDSIMLMQGRIYHNKLLKDNEMEITCVDGKSERGTVLENSCNPDIVSAYSPPTGITLLLSKK